MKKISSSYYLAVLTRLLILVVLANLISLAFFWILPQSSQEIEERTDYTTDYMKIDFANMLRADGEVATSGVGGIQRGDLILKGLYGGRNRGFVIVAMQSSSQVTAIVGVGEDFNGYKLKTISRDSAVFQKENQEYEILLEDAHASALATNAGMLEQIKVISKSEIASYIKNPIELAKNISVQEVKVGAVLKGYRITSIAPNSRFDRLGLKQGDIIEKVNNRVLGSYADVMNIYKNIDKLSALQIVVKRDNQEKEFLYEIN